MNTLQDKQKDIEPQINKLGGEFSVGLKHLEAQLKNLIDLHRYARHVVVSLIPGENYEH